MSAIPTLLSYTNLMGMLIPWLTRPQTHSPFRSQWPPASAPCAVRPRAHALERRHKPCTVSQDNEGVKASTSLACSTKGTFTVFGASTCTLPPVLRFA